VRESAYLPYFKFFFKASFVFLVQSLWNFIHEEEGRKGSGRRRIRYGVLVGVNPNLLLKVFHSSNSFLLLNFAKNGAKICHTTVPDWIRLCKLFQVIGRYFLKKQCLKLRLREGIKRFYSFRSSRSFIFPDSEINNSSAKCIMIFLQLPRSPHQ
jgi:hypothetical protein